VSPWQYGYFKTVLFSDGWIKNMEQEITESTIMKDLQSVMSTLKTSKNTGVMLSVDDFGTGYSFVKLPKKVSN